MRSLSTKLDRCWRGFKDVTFSLPLRSSVTLGNPLFLWDDTMWSWLDKHSRSRGNREQQVPSRSKGWSPGQRPAPWAGEDGDHAGHSRGAANRAPGTRPYSGSSREGGFSHNQQSAPHSGPLLDCFLLTCFLLQQVPLHGPPGSAHGDLVSTVPSDRGRHRCPLRSFPIAALREGAGETPVFKAPSQSTTLLPSEGYKPGSSYPGSLESWCLLGWEACWTREGDDRRVRS